MDGLNYLNIQRYFFYFLQSERRAERLSRARRPQCGTKRRRAAARLPRQQPKENDCAGHADDARSGTPPHFEYVVQRKPESVYRLLFPETLSLYDGYRHNYYTKSMLFYSIRGDGALVRGEQRSPRGSGASAARRAKRASAPRATEPRPPLGEDHQEGEL